MLSVSSRSRDIPTALRASSECNGRMVSNIHQEIVVFNVDFPTDTSDIKFRAVQWICTEVLLALAAIVNFLPRELSHLIGIIVEY